MPPDLHVYALVLKRIYDPENFILTGSSSLKELNWSETFGQKRATPTVG